MLKLFNHPEMNGLGLVSAFTVYILIIKQVHAFLDIHICVMTKANPLCIVRTIQLSVVLSFLFVILGNMSLSLAVNFMRTCLTLALYSVQSFFLKRLFSPNTSQMFEGSDVVNYVSGGGKFWNFLELGLLCIGK